MFSRFIAIAIALVLCCMLFACTKDTCKAENSVEPLRSYTVKDVHTYEFVPPGAPHMLCVMQSADYRKGGGLSCFPAVEVQP